MKNKYIEAVESENIVRVRLSLSNELMLDPRGDSFNEMKAFAESHMTNLYDEDDSKSYSMNVSDWNEELMFAIKNDLDDNFSKEKLSIYEKVAKTVLKDKAEQLTKEEATRATRIVSASNKARSSEQEKKNSNKQIYTGITVGSAAVAVTGLCLSRVALASLGFAGVLIGGILLYNESKK